MDENPQEENPQSTDQTNETAKAKPKAPKRSYNGSKIETLLAKADNGELNIAPDRQKGLLEEATERLIYDGPDALLQAERQAAKLAKRFGVEFEANWFLETEWLKQMRLAHRGCTRVRHALRWRPRFLAAMALSNSAIIAARHAHVPRCTAYRHRTLDRDFAAQWEAAEAYAIQLLHDVCFKSAIEGDCEPVYWQGIKVGHIKKFDSRLRIEMLRAHMPEKFKAPGGANININNDARQITVYSPEAAQEIQARRHAALNRTAELEGRTETADGIDVAKLLRDNG